MLFKDFMPLFIFFILSFHLIFNNSFANSENDDMDPFSSFPVDIAPQPNLEIDETGQNFLFPVDIAPLSQLEIGDNFIVLGYHKVEDMGVAKTKSHDINYMVVSPELFDQQMSYLKESGFVTLTFKNIMEYRENKWPLPPKAAIISFDDGYLSVYENAFPIMKKYGFVGVVFIIPQVVGIRTYSNDHFTWDNLKEMMDNGFECGSHTMNHPDLSQLDQEALNWQLGESRNTIEKMTEASVISLAYPMGKHNNRIIQTARELGYALGLTTIGGINNLEQDLFRLKRNFPLYNDSLATFKRLFPVDQSPENGNIQE